MRGVGESCVPANLAVFAALRTRMADSKESIHESGVPESSDSRRLTEGQCLGGDEGGEPASFD